ncbi:MAG: UvrD-helicase domain-containing protein, partial [Betaproteobacteria bacterium]|nr:UvrD-helicase domain-containing protein [Betaproteobacteria bacterium]
MILDESQRQEALDIRRSFIVQAPAGSGKTDLLVKRFVALLGVVRQPEEVLAITFTRKAAAEMRKRVLEALGKPELAHRLRIQTIDALCVSLARGMPVLARFGAAPAIVEDAPELYRVAAARTLSQLNPAVERLLAHLDNNVGEASYLLAQLLATRDRWLRRTGAAPTRAELEASFVAERERLLAKARLLHPKASEDWARELLTNDFKWRKRNAEAQALSQNEPLRVALAALCQMPPARYTDEQWAALESILALLVPAVTNLKLVFSERGEADFTEFAHGALRALGSAEEPSDLLLAIDRQVSHILVDEFQDTSLSQFELLQKLTSGWEPGDGRTVFLVGDPMQSIYRFREAEVSLFLRARHEGLGHLPLEPLTLSTNFRSQAKVVEWLNATFPRVLPAEEDAASGAVPYSPCSARHPALEGAAVSWNSFYSREEEAKRVAQIVKDAKGTSAILVRNRAHLDEIVPALNDAGIRFRAVEIEHLGEKQVVQDLYALTRALTHLGDRVAALSVLRAPWCGLTLRDLLLLVAGPAAKGDSPQLGLFEEGNKEEDLQPKRSDLVSDLMRDVSHLSADGQARVARVREVLGAAWRNRARGSLRTRVEGAWLALGGPACVAEATDLEDAEIFFDELERLEEAGSVDLEPLAESLGRLYALPDVEAGEDAVEIMTIHKAKGLEFDNVIVPGLDRIPRAGFRPLMAWKALQEEKLLLAPVNPSGTEKEPAYHYLRELEKQAEDIESARLFYVAATRAKSRLHLLACGRPDKDGAKVREPSKRSFLAKVWWQAMERFGPPPESASAPRTPDPVHDVFKRLSKDFVLPEIPKAVAFDSMEEAKDENNVEFSWAGETARHVGTIVHRWLQRMAEDALEGWDSKRVESLKPRFAAELERRGVPHEELARSADAIAAALANALADERGRWVLGPHAEAASESRVRARMSGAGAPAGFRTFVMDRVFRDERGERWIVDYKTSRHEGADAEGFLDRELERYARQLEDYASASPGARTALYFPLLKGWR